MHVFGGFAAVLCGLGGGLHILLLHETRAEGHQGIDHGAVTRLGRGVLGQCLAGVAEGFGPDGGGGWGDGVLLVLGAKTVGQGVEEDGVDGARGAVHGVFDNGHDAVHCCDQVVGEVGGGVFEEFEDGFGTALQANTAVTVADDGVVAGDGGFGGDDALKGRSKDILKGGGVH